MSLCGEKNVKSLTAWRDENCEKDDDGHWRLKEELRSSRLHEAAEVYADYCQELKNRGSYDYSDMITELVGALEANRTLRSNILEAYQYVLVDEFQDTSLSQLRIIAALGSDPSNGGRPNIFAVGDDDQGIYKFQGAEVSNMLRFIQMFKGVELITLDQNYRSSQLILDFSREVILNGVERLENKIEEVTKKLESNRTGAFVGPELITFNTRAMQVGWLVDEIKTLKNKGADLSQVAIIARKHASLERMASALSQANIPINYEAEEDILVSDFIESIVEIIRLVTKAGEGNPRSVNSLILPVISHDSFDLTAAEIWSFNLYASSQKDDYLTSLGKSQNPKLRRIYDFIVELVKSSASDSLEDFIDKLIGNKPLNTKGLVSQSKTTFFQALT